MDCVILESLGQCLLGIAGFIFDKIVEIAAIVAAVTYFLQKRDQKKAAATLIKSQIDSIESVVKDLKNIVNLTNVEIYKSKSLFTKNYWEESKYLLTKKLGVDNIRIIEDFYTQAEYIEKARQEICNEMTIAWEHKDEIVQEKTYELVTTNNQEISENVKLFEMQDKIFEPAMPRHLLKTSISSFPFLSGTTAYEKITKMSYYK